MAQIYYTEAVKTIESIVFTIISNKEVYQRSAVKEDANGIDSTELYDEMRPKKGGLIDARMGVIDNYSTCDTCNLTSMNCPGHFGHIELAEPLFHVEFLKFIPKILNCICLRCARVRVNKTEKEIINMLKTHKSPKQRFAEIRSLTKNISYCQRAGNGCGTPAPKIKIVTKKNPGTVEIIAQTDIKKLSEDGETLDKKKKTIQRTLTPEICKNILRLIPDNDCLIMGLDPNISRPNELILTQLPVPPVSVRPSIKMDTSFSATMEDRLTASLGNVIKANARIHKHKDTNSDLDIKQKFLKEHSQLLHYTVSSYMDSDSNFVPKNDQKNTGNETSLAKRLKSKEGRIRGNLMGKRVDFSARTVITPDPNISIEEIGIPVKIARTLTYPQIVTPKNYKQMVELVKKGKYEYAGANFVKLTSANKLRTNNTVDYIYLKNRKNVSISIGDTVERHIVDGDVVLFNRQPSLHKLSTMAHKARIINNPDLATFRLNECCTSSYNADFDGDEMNIFPPQSQQATVELLLIAAVSRNIMNPSATKPNIGGVQDTPLGGYLLTSDRVKISGPDAMNLLMYTKISTERLHSLDKTKTYTGQEVYNLIMPTKINAFYKRGDKTLFQCKDGVLEPGSRLSKETIANSKGSLIHHIYNQHKHTQAKYFIDNTRRLIIQWLTQNGFSVGVKDVVIKPNIQKQIDVMIASKKLEVNHLITEMENDSLLRDPELFESGIIYELNVLRDNISKLIVNNMHPYNSFNVMYLAGSKGSPINIVQMSGTLGQQDIDGKRVKKNFNGRTLPHYHRDDDSVEARGYVTSCYLKGLTPQEFFFHTMSGRQGLIDTAIKSVTGDTKIVIIESDKPKYVSIGDWIDMLMLNNEKVHHKDDVDTLQLTHDVHIPTTDFSGNVMWSHVSYVTRHDPGKQLYEVKTSGLRRVIVTESKSLLIWNGSKFEERLMSTVVVGDKVPVTLKLETPPFVINPSVELNESTVDMFITADDHTIKAALHDYITKYGVDISKLTVHMTDVLSMLCARLGIYCNGKSLLIEQPDEVANDVVLESIVEINKIDPKDYPKVYDITVPDTTNFCLANGLHVVDTAETGYVQRKLMKALENNYVTYDGTVRNERGILMQTIYGDVGTHAVRQSDQKIKFLLMDNEEVKKNYIFSKDEVKKYGVDEERNKKLYKKIIDLRDTLRKTQIKATRNYKTIKDIYTVHLDVVSLISTYVNSREKEKKSEGQLDFTYIMNTLETLMTHKYTPVMKMTDAQANDPKSFKYQDEQCAKIAFEAVIYDNLAPKKCFLVHKFSKAQFDALIKEIVVRFMDSFAEAGEMVGPLAAQSIGSVLTQLSTSRDTFIVVEHRSRVIRKPIGDYIDEVMDEARGTGKLKRHGTSEILSVLDDEIKVLSINQREKASWRKITELSRHPANGKLVKVTTSTGRSLTATLSHSFLTKTKEGIVPIKGSDLKVGIRMPVMRSTPEVKNPISHVKIGDMKVELTEEFCEFLGIFISEGSTCKSSDQVCITSKHDYYQKLAQKTFSMFTDNKIKTRKKSGHIIGSKKKYIGYDTVVNCAVLSKWLRANIGTYSHNKTIPNFVYQMKKERVGDFFRGLFDGDGNVNAPKKSIKYHSTSLSMIHQIMFLLTYFDIRSSFQLERKEDPKRGTKNLYVILIFGADNGKQFHTEIGTNLAYKMKAMEKYVNSTEKSSDFVDKMMFVADRVKYIAKGLKLVGRLVNGGKGRGKYSYWCREEKKGNYMGRRVLREYIDLFDEKDVDENYTEEINELRDIVNGSVFWDPITSLEYIEDDGELVYDFSVQTNENFVTDCGMYIHNTLNSVDYNEQVIIKDKDTLVQNSIGQIIDTLLDKHKDVVQYIEKGDQSYLDVKNYGFKIMSIDSQSKTEWLLIEAVTKHLPLHEDKIDNLLNVKTQSGREVTATKAKSFLIYEEGIVKEINGSDLKIGMKIPVIHEHKDDSTVLYDEVVSIREVPSSHKYVYDFTVEKTRNFCLANGIACRDTFHSSGIAEKSSGTLGVPRLRELMSLARYPKSPKTSVFIDKKYYTNKAACNKIASYIQYTIIEDVVNKLDIYYDPQPDRKDGFMVKDDIKNAYVTITSSKTSCQNDIKGLPWLIRLTLDKEKMLNREITLLDIKTKFCEYWANRYVDSKGMKRDDKLLMEKVIKCTVLSNYDNSDVPIIHVRLQMKNYDKNTCINFANTILTKFALKGVEGMTKVNTPSLESHVELNKETGAIEYKERYVIYADGVGLGELRYIDGIDLSKTSSNHILDIYKYFGIEAARSALLKEFKILVEASGSGTNYQHWTILVDAMTSNNILTSVDRHGMGKLETEPLSRASFERPVDQFVNAAMFRETEPMRSVAANIMTGQMINGGTGLCMLALNTKMLESTEFPDTDVNWRKNGIKYKTVQNDSLIDDILNKKGEETDLEPDEPDSGSESD